MSVQLVFYTLRIRKKRRSNATLLPTDDDCSLLSSPVATQASTKGNRLRDMDTPTDSRSALPPPVGSDFFVAGALNPNNSRQLRESLLTTANDHDKRSVSSSMSHSVQRDVRVESDSDEEAEDG